MEQEEFYGDRIVNRIENIAYPIARILFVGGSFFPLALTLAKILRWQPAIDLSTPAISGISHGQLFLLVVLPWPVSVLIRKFPLLVRKIRKARYPSESFVRHATGHVVERKIRKDKDGNRNHYIKVTHAQDPSGVFVQVDENTYGNVRINDVMDIRYHPDKRGMLYIKVKNVEAF